MVEVHEFFRVLRHRVAIVIILTAIGIGVAAVWIERNPNHYAATTRLFISSGTSTSQYDAQQGGIYAQDRVISYENLVNSRALAQRTIDALELDLDANELAADVSSTTVPNSAVMDVSVTAESPQRAKDIADGLAQQFVAMAATLETPPDGVAPAVRVNIIDTANVGTKARALPDLLIYFLGGLIGFIAGLMIAFLVERFSGRVRDRVDVERATGEQPVAELAASGDDLLPLSEAQSVEAIQRLRLAVSDANVVAITSLSGRAAKAARGFAATTAVRLAASLGTEEGSAVLIVLDPDADVALRVGRLVEELENDGRQASVRWSLNEGASHDHVLLSPSAVAEKLQRLQSEFDHVIVLIAPPADNAAAAAVASAVGGVVAVGIYDRSTVDDLQKHQADCRRNGATSLGISVVRQRRSGALLTMGRGRTPDEQVHGAEASAPQAAQSRHSVATMASRNGAAGGLGPVESDSHSAT